MVDDADVVHILRREEAVPLFVPVRFENVELLFPVAQQRRIHVEHLRHFAHGVVYLALFVVYLLHRWKLVGSG